MSERQFPELQAVLIEDNDFKTEKIQEALDSLGVQQLGRIATFSHAVEELDAYDHGESMFTGSNLILVDGDLGTEGGSGDGNQILLSFIRQGIAYTPAAAAMTGQQSLERVALGCSVYPQNAYADLVAGANFNPYTDTPDDLAAMLMVATDLLARSEEPDL